MPTRDKAPTGSPCWADLWTSDVEGSRKFYAALFGWEAQETNPEFGGYFMFTRNGAPIAGGMGDMGDLRADNHWKIYLETDDVGKTVTAADSEGGRIIIPATPVADLGVQAILEDSTGATVGAWQPETFSGFAILGEHGTPSWFELLTREHARAIAFYRAVFGWDTKSVSDSDEFRYTSMGDPESDAQLAGIMDAASFLPEGAPASWSIYWATDDIDATVADAKALGGSVVMDPTDTPYGRLATATDPAGAQFKLRSLKA
jgi:predicted enzyme related to lactoylglutathione lyase